ncbi:hypothetical protein AHF37_10311 [Paragonimus kellicotti]|nr:hypothetical protein AHF37_10311 [Paragonimus kellicotti]
MATMLNGAAVMDAALLLIASNEPCPQPQTSEHLAAVEIMRLKYIIILQNKIDLIKESQAREQYDQVSLMTLPSSQFDVGGPYCPCCNDSHAWTASIRVYYLVNKNVFL